MSAPAPSVTFEAISRRLLQSRPTASDLSTTLGGPAVAPGADATFALRTAPLVSVNVSEFRGVVDVVFDLAPGPWKLQDVVSDPTGWSSGPRLAGSGALDSTRTWSVPGRSITCVLRLEGDGPLATRRVVGQPACQVSAL